jgi:ABC-2 type transport system permease protein
MNCPSNAAPDSLEPERTAPAALAEPRPLYWSIRRELWENRSIYIAPLAAAGLGIFGFLISLIGLPATMRGMSTHHPRMSLTGQLAMPYAHVAWIIVVTGFIVGIFYSLDALYGERRDRSILFWKSLPVSDVTIVLSKAVIPIVVLPLLIFAIIVITQTLMLLLGSIVLQLSGVGAAAQWEHLPLFQMQLVWLYGLIAMALWHAPIYGWLLLVSAWARRTPILWAILPPLALMAVERTAFSSWHFANLLKYRMIGWFLQGFNLDTHGGPPIDPHFLPLTQITPGKFLASPSLWLGLVVTAVFLAAAVRLRRYREPI